MTETNGHFEEGRWVDDSSSAAARNNPSMMETRISEATASVIKSVEDLANVSHDLVTTEEGKQYLEKTLKDARAEIRKNVDRMIGSARLELRKKTHGTL